MSGGIQIFSIVITTLLPTISILIIYADKKNLKISKQSYRLLLILMAYILYMFCISEDLNDIIFIGYRSVRFLMAFLILNYCIIRNLNFVKELEVVLFICFLHALANMVVVNTLFDSFLPITNSVSRHLYIFFAQGSDYSGLIRNQGLFWEPGVLQLFMNLYLYILLFEKKAVNRLLSSLVVIVIISTFSTVGLILCVIQLLLYFKPSNMSLYSVAGFVVFLGLFYTLLGDQILQQILYKFSGKGQGSFLARQYDFLSGLNIIKHHPLGIGFSTEKYLAMVKGNPFGFEIDLDHKRYSTNGLLILFYSSGLFWGFYWLTKLWRQRLFSKWPLLVNTILVVSLLSEPLFFTPFVLIIVFSSLYQGASQL